MVRGLFLYVLLTFPGVQPRPISIVVGKKGASGNEMPWLLINAKSALEGVKGNKADVINLFDIYIRLVYGGTH